VRRYRAFCEFVGLMQLVLCGGCALWWIAQQVFAVATPVLGRLVDQLPPWTSRAFICAVILNGAYLTLAQLFRGIRERRGRKRFIAEMKAKGLFRDYLK
jgi:hypothetical protein